MTKIQNEVTANAVVAKVLNRGVRYFNVETLKTEEKKAYISDLIKIARNKSFQNEINHIIADFVHEIAHSAPDMETVTALRYSINGLELLMERLNDVGLDKIEPSKEEVFNGV